jgi:hypothetical protein
MTIAIVTVTYIIGAFITATIGHRMAGHWTEDGKYELNENDWELAIFAAMWWPLTLCILACGLLCVAIYWPFDQIGKTKPIQRVAKGKMPKKLKRV